MAVFFMDPHKISSLLQISLFISKLCCSYLFMVKQQEGKKTAQDVFMSFLSHFNLSVCKMKLEKKHETARRQCDPIKKVFCL